MAALNRLLLSVVLALLSGAASASAQTPDVADDAVVQARVLTALVADDVLDARAVSIEVSEGIVRLSVGELDATAWQRARTLVAAVDGVRQVQMLQPQPEGDVVEADVAPRALAEAIPDAVRIGTPSDTIYELPELEGSGALDRAASGDRPRTYTVQAGDSLSIIASRTMGNGGAWPRIFELNRSVIGNNPDGLREGMVLRIPQD